MTNKKYFISKMWASDVKKRDSKKCIICGSKEDLEAHHIFGISQYPYLTAELNNGITLCKLCHNKYHNQYKEINPLTWTQFLLNNQNNIINLEINYSNGYKEKIPIKLHNNPKKTFHDKKDTENEKINKQIEKIENKEIITLTEENELQLKT